MRPCPNDLAVGAALGINPRSVSVLLGKLRTKRDVEAERMAHFAERGLGSELKPRK